MINFGETRKTFRFHRPGVELDTIDVEFQDGKSQREEYFHWKSKAFDRTDSTGSFSKSDIESVLKANSRGLTWRKRLPNPRDPPGSTTWLLGSNDPNTAVAEAVSNSEYHRLALWLTGYDLSGDTDAVTAAELERLFPVPAKTPEPVPVTTASKQSMFPVLKVLGQPQSVTNKILGEPQNHHLIREPDKPVGGIEVEYPDGPNWKFLDIVFYRERLSSINFLFRQPYPASEDELFQALGLPKNEFRTISNTSRGLVTTYRGVVNKRVIEINATHPGALDGAGFCTLVGIDLIETLD